MLKIKLLLTLCLISLTGCASNSLPVYAPAQENKAPPVAVWTEHPGWPMQELTTLWQNFSAELTQSDSDAPSLISTQYSLTSRSAQSK